MAGQTVWKDHGAPDSAYVVMPQIVRGIYEAATYGTVFGKLNGGKEVATTEVAHRGGSMKIDAGNDSPVWQKPMTENNTARFTLRERNVGMATYGDADVRTGRAAQYKHTDCFVRKVDTPASPIVGFESAENFKRVVNDLVKLEKDAIASWVSEEMDFDAFRAIFMGASRGILGTADGGMGKALVGANVGEFRAPLNTFVAGQTTPSLTPMAWSAATHNGNLASRLAALATTPTTNQFTYGTHVTIDGLINDLRIQPVKVGGHSVRAVALIDPWNMASLRRDANFIQLFSTAAPRSDTNLALFNRGYCILDDILYLPTEQLKFFRPTVSGGNITWGAGMDVDPRTMTVGGQGAICPTIVLGRGALLRGQRRGDLWFTVKEGDHGKGQSYCGHYHDGWVRHDWAAQDGRQELANDSSLVLFNNGVLPIGA